MDRLTGPRWGGYAAYGGTHATDQGAVYDPVSDTRTVMSDGYLTARCDHTLSWMGDVAFVFGCVGTCGSPNLLADGCAAIHGPAIDQ